MKEHLGPNPPELCEHCDEFHVYRDGLCWRCLTEKWEVKAEERHDREVIKRLERNRNEQ